MLIFGLLLHLIGWTDADIVVASCLVGTILLHSTWDAAMVISVANVAADFVAMNWVCLAM